MSLLTRFLQVSAVILALLVPADAAVLWQIGTPDDDDREFALAPANYRAFSEDAVYFVGASKPGDDWLYVQPGPADVWAGSRSHTYRVVFNTATVPAGGQCKLVLDFVNTHYGLPPEISVGINGREFRQKTTAGAGDDSLSDPSKGRESKLQFEFPVSLLQVGLNTVRITTESGSWVIYDAVTLEAPDGTSLGPMRETTTAFITPPAQDLLRGEDGKPYRSVRVSLRRAGGEAEAVFKLDGSVVQRQVVKPGRTEVDVHLPEPEKKRVVDFAVEVGGQTVAAEKLTIEPVRKWVVYLLPHSHNDIGYTDVQDAVERKQWGYIDTALDAIKASAGYPDDARFRWNVEVMWAVDSYLKRASPERRKQFIEAAKSGAIGVDALYGNELTALCRPEELIRLMSRSNRFSKDYGVPVDSAMISDVPGYTWGIVSAMAESGVRYFSLGPNGGDRIGRTLMWADKPFYWVGPSGQNKVLCWMIPGGYIFQRLPDAGASPILSRLKELERRGYPYDTVQIRYAIYSDNGPPDTKLSDFVRQWNETHVYPRLVISTTSRMFHDFEKQYGPKVPEVKGDFTPYWEDGAGSSARETAINREAAERLVQAETLWAMKRPGAYPALEFENAWRNVILYDEHTWGAYNSISEPDAPFVKEQWKIKQAFALDADTQSKSLLASAAAGPSSEAAAFDVYNTSSWPRTDLVLLPASIRLSGDVVKDQSGKVVPSQRLSTGELAFLASNIPPFAARRYIVRAGTVPTAGTARAAGLVLSTDALSLRIDGNTGAVASLVPAWLKKELVDRSKGTGLNEYIYIKGSDFANPQKVEDVKVTVKERGPLVASLLVTSSAPGCNGLTREVRVVDGLERVELIDTVDKQACREKDGVHFAFPFNVPGGVMRMDTPWAVVRPEADQMPGACKNWFTVQRWVDVSRAGYGVTWATVHAPLVEAGGITADRIASQPDPNAWIEHLAPSQAVYSWAMNNYWHTNYKADQEGPTVFKYVLYPHGPFDAAQSARFGAESSQPLVATVASGKPPVWEPRLELSSKGVVVTAFKPAEDGGGVIVRLFGGSGKKESVSLKWSDPKPARVWLSNAREERVSPLRGAVTAPGYGIVTLRAEFGK